MKTDEVREKYLTFFEGKGHVRQASDVLVPTWDPSVLFTPAGMNQFKDHFLGKVKLDYTRATTSQKCLRTGDIDNVGRTAYHHTFFEMLGNFSFGDYFKRDAITWAWEFLTDSKWLGIEPSRLSVTVYTDDDEAAKIWQDEIHLPSSHVSRMGENDNFWPAGAPSGGPDGVCGPCSEIFYMGDDGKEVEIWNLVFTQFNRVGDPPDNLRPLPSKNIDTGMGLERIAAVLQGVTTNYHIDILRPIVEAAGEVCEVKYDAESDTGRRLRRITDHVRACSFAIHENVYPGANKEKYVIRRLLRRAILDGHQMGRRTPFLCDLVPAVVQQMAGPYPELKQTIDRVAQVMRKEETDFLASLDDALGRIDRVFAEMRDSGSTIVDGREAASLYQTYGVPPELTESMAADADFTFDWDGFRGAMREHGIDSGSDQFELFKSGPVEQLKRVLHETPFLGYETTATKTVLKGIIVGDELCSLHDQTGVDSVIRLVLEKTTFYGESGGQVGDTGIIECEQFRFVVTDTQKDGDLVLHVGYLESGTLESGVSVEAIVDVESRQAIRRAHSATHILHYALQKHLGSHAQQQGSKVDRDVLRFDFTNLELIPDEVLEEIEKSVSERVAAKEAIKWETISLPAAREAGAMMLFGEKYPDPVRMVTMGEFSRELCGGTHLDNTEEVQAFEIVSEEGVSAGTRRVTAYTGARAQENADRTTSVVSATALALQVGPSQMAAAIRGLVARVRDLKKTISSGGKPKDFTIELPPAAEQGYAQTRCNLRDASRLLNVSSVDVTQRVDALLAEEKKLCEQVAMIDASGSLSADTLLENAEQKDDYVMVVAETPGASPNLMRQLIDAVRKKSGGAAVLLASTTPDGKVTLVAGVSKTLLDRGAHAGNWVKEVAAIVGGGGGGKPDLAQAGGRDPSRLPEALEKAREVIAGMTE